MNLQNPSRPSLHAGARCAEFPDLEEAARYALLQCLAPALQHHMIGGFQSIGMVAALMERHLQSAAPDLAIIREDCASLRRSSETAIGSIIDLMTWVEPKTASLLKFQAGLRQCLSLLSSELRFRGFVIVNEVPEIDVELSSRALRSVLCATLIALSDPSQAPADLVIRARVTPEHVELSIARRPNEGDARKVYMTDFRPLKWRDVEMLAIADAVTLTHGHEGAALTFTPITPITPLTPITLSIRADQSAHAGLPGDPAIEAGSQP